MNCVFVPCKDRPGYVECVDCHQQHPEPKIPPLRAKCRAFDEPRKTTKKKKQAPTVPPEGKAGVGTELKMLLGRFFIKEKKGCGCGHHAITLNLRGPDWCEKNMDVIVCWLRAEAKKRHLPFIDTAGRVIVRRAIFNARRKKKILPNEGKE